ncbi:MAG TPA: DUF4505 domain-containing protein [Leptospiraceae bacterium]|nr:hypothetical protein [Spirochaetaceae bacterium]HBS05775.1 DUF4505 domain-containing protein [Leptospiraceae bacterium]|tara:strand:+ start:35704 stop:36240 length:537 start_codon:yes stop_codon:yes gene_type:complete
MPARKIERIYFYDIDGKGRLYHDGTLQDDIDFLDFFFERLKPNDTGMHDEYPYVSPCGREMNFVRSSGAPIVFRKMDERQNVLIFGGSLTFPWQPEKLVIGSDGQLYHPAPFLLGRISPELLLEWQKYLDFNDGWVLRPEGPFSSLNTARELAAMDLALDQNLTLPHSDEKATTRGAT